MAQYTHSSRTTVTPYFKTGGDYDLRAFYTSTVAASSGIIAYGDVVQFDVNVSSANDRIVKSSTMANAPNVISTAFLGIAMEADPNAATISSAAPGTGQKMLVCCAGPNTSFKFPTKAAGTVHASSLIGLRKAIAYDSTLSFFYADIGNSTAGDASLVITDVIDPGTSNGFVVAKFLSTAVARLISHAY